MTVFLRAALCLLAAFFAIGEFFFAHVVAQAQRRETRFVIAALAAVDAGIVAVLILAAGDLR